ncbi:MAG: hypothetical protein J3K34DRAFT_407523 [Monoraphidium minutum]|nr:MAG: hypothetical protein J3K34DRAFT_407523 [Monoraphidium minutum]
MHAPFPPCWAARPGPGVACRLVFLLRGAASSVSLRQAPPPRLWGPVAALGRAGVRPRMRLRGARPPPNQSWVLCNPLSTWLPRDHPGPPTPCHLGSKQAVACIV